MKTRRPSNWSNTAGMDIGRSKLQNQSIDSIVVVVVVVVCLFVCLFVCFVSKRR